MVVCIYIDWANFHQWSKIWGGVNYKKFRKWLSDKYNHCHVFLFLWYLKENTFLYSKLYQQWYFLIFKETLEIEWKVKGNCDTDLVLKAVENFYEEQSSHTILITWDGDFACLVDFFIQKKHFITLLAPNKLYCSYLLKKRNIPLIFLEEQKHKFQ